MRSVCGDAPEEPRYRLDLAEMLFAGEPRERLEAVSLWIALANDPERVTSTLRSEALEKLARAAAIRGDFVEVRRLIAQALACLLYTSPSPRDGLLSRMPSSA